MKCLLHDFDVRNISWHLNFMILQKFYILKYFKFAFF